tara:strand:- start:575 stop:1270 length:696 start_codon:yes stop_codon:yes gene_type:complete
MSKKTKHQRYYAKHKNKRTNYFTQEDTQTGYKVDRVSLCVRVSSDASQRLIELSESESLPRWKMLTRIILYSIPTQRKFFDSSDAKNDPTNSLESETKKIKYKGTTGEAQINARITATAWNKLEFWANAKEMSKARIIQFLILNYKPTPQHVRDKQKKKRDEEREKYGYASDYFTPKSDRSPRSKFINNGGTYEHRKGIPIENWDEEEYDEYLRLVNSEAKSNPSCIEGEE